MTERDFNELAGRTEALSSLVLHLVAQLEMTQKLDSQVLSKQARDSATTLRFDAPHLDATKRNLVELADSIDRAYKWRQKQTR